MESNGGFMAIGRSLLFCYCEKFSNDRLSIGRRPLWKKSSRVCGIERKEESA